MTEKIIIVDFGGQYTQLIARKVRECHVYCEIQPCHKSPDIEPDVKGVILSGSPFSVNDPAAPGTDIAAISQKVPVLGICYGAQLMARQFGGEVAKSNMREYGRSRIQPTGPGNSLLDGVTPGTQVWMSHADSIIRLPEGFEVIATTSQIPVAAFQKKEEGRPGIYGLQFHPEVSHSEQGIRILSNFLLRICGCSGHWTPASFVAETIASIRSRVADRKAVMALSGGVDSTVAATLIREAIGDRLYCIFVDNGLLRKGEFRQVLDSYHQIGLNVKGVEARDRFYAGLAGKILPEEKRKAIGRIFIEVFQKEARDLQGISFLGQGTIYPDVIESVSVNGPSQTIKSHHNVGGLPEKMHLELLEPLRYLFKDEVRKIGREIGVSEEFLERHPFPGPGLGIRILGEVTSDKVSLLQEADAIYTNLLREMKLYDQVWQAGAILLPVQSVGVMGDERTYEYTVALRAVTSTDGMTADWAHLPFEFLARASSDIINQVRGINRVVYDISSKPPATIEWE
ncbi:MAG TPA: glutamine-hydrolyzing GMP synthase [Chitinophagaceae bacterium]|nr:glutamine-hydrolyzing GMP synthase [Chitinophagaceae bacterium]